MRNADAHESYCIAMNLVGAIRNFCMAFGARGDFISPEAVSSYCVGGIQKRVANVRYHIEIATTCTSG